MTSYARLVADAQRRVREIMPWDLRERLDAGSAPLLLDVREPAEFALAHIAGALNAPRGVLEASCDWGYDETLPELVRARHRPVVVICRSGNRSILAADVMQQMGYTDVVSLKTGLRGWNDYEQPLVDGPGRALDTDTAEPLLAARVRPDQQAPREAPPPGHAAG